MRLRPTALAALLAAGLTGVGAGSAHADDTLGAPRPQSATPCDWQPPVDGDVTGSGFHQDDVPIYSGDFDVCPIVGEGNLDDNLTIHCYLVNPNGWGWAFIDVDRNRYKFEGWAQLAFVVDPGHVPTC